MQSGKARHARSFTLDDAADLSWVWRDAEGEMGMRSSFGTMLERAAAGQLFEERACTLADTLPRPGACARFARVSKTLVRLGEDMHGLLHGRVLFAVYGPPPRLGSVDDLAQKALRSERGLVLRHLPGLRALAEKRFEGRLALAIEAEAKAKRLVEWSMLAKEALGEARASYARARNRGLALLEAAA